MTLRFIDSFDHYVTADFLTKYNLVNSTPTISAGNGRRGTSSLRLTNAAQGLRKTLDAQATWIVGFSFKCAALPASTRTLITFFDPDGTNAHIIFYLLASGAIRVDRSSTPLVTSTQTIVGGGQYFLEFKVTIADASGVAALRINGVLDSSLNFSGDTRNAGTAAAQSIELVTGSSLGATWDIDDLYICDANGSINNDFLGDRAAEALFPTAEANYSAWTPSTGTDNSANVDDASPDADGTYNDTLTALAKDTFTFGNLSVAAADIAGIQYNLISRKDNSGPRFVAPMSRQSAADFVSSVAHSLLDTYFDHHQIKETNPSTAAAWTVADINTDSEFGYRLES